MDIIRNTGKRDDLKLDLSGGSGLATVAYTGSYTDLINTPTIPAAQIQSDWNETNSLLLDYIKNKPTIPAQFNPIAGVNMTISGTYPNMTFTSAGGGGSIVTSLPSAYALGILDNGSDQTSALQTILNNTSYAGVTIDFSAPGAVTVNGTLNCNGKILRFVGGSYITGTGTITSPMIDIDWMHQGFSTTITLTSALSTRPFTSVKLFGAVGDGSTDDTAALQKVSDTVIANLTLPRKLVVPPQNFKTTDVWKLYNWNGTDYQQWNLEIVGAQSAPGSYFTDFPTITCTTSVTGAIALQRGYGTIIDGLTILGPFTTSLSYDTFTGTTFSSVSSTRDSRYSPHFGIAIDWVTTSAGTIPSDGGYPGYNASAPTNWYRGTGINSGSTGVIIRNCNIRGFTVDIINSPNGFTEQGEDCVVENCQLDYAKVAIAYCQTQSDRTLVRLGRSWYYLWTVIDTASYGTQQGYLAQIDGYNVAAYVNTLFNVTAPKAMQINSFYAESLFQIGNLVATYSSIVVTSPHWDLYTGDYTVAPANHIGFCQNVRFTGGIIRYYDGLYNKRLRINVVRNVVMENVQMDLPPYITSYDNLSQTSNITYINCALSINMILGQQNDIYRMQVASTFPVLYGKFSIQDYTGLDSSDGGQGIENPANTSVIYSFDCQTLNRYNNNFTGSITFTPSSGSATFTADTSVCRINDIVVEYVSGNFMGRISAINTGAGTVTVSEIPSTVTAGTYRLYLVYFLYFQTPFVGDITLSSNQITNVTTLYGTVAVNQRIDHLAFPLGTYVTNVTGTTVTVSNVSTVTATRQNFVLGNPQITVNSLYAPSSSTISSYSKAFAAGTIWNEQVTYLTTSICQPNVWAFNQGGVLNATSLSLSSAFQADYNLTYNYRIVGGNLQYFDNTIATWTNI